MPESQTELLERLNSLKDKASTFTEKIETAKVNLKVSQRQQTELAAKLSNALGTNDQKEWQSILERIGSEARNALSDLELALQEAGIDE